MSMLVYGLGGIRPSAWSISGPGTVRSKCHPLWCHYTYEVRPKSWNLFLCHSYGLIVGGSCSGDRNLYLHAAIYMYIHTYTYVCMTCINKPSCVREHGTPPPICLNLIIVILWFLHSRSFAKTTVFSLVGTYRLSPSHDSQNWSLHITPKQSCNIKWVKPRTSNCSHIAERNNKQISLEHTHERKAHKHWV